MKEDTSRIVSALLWRAKAIQISDGEPFTLASGNRSPIYVDCRRLASFPASRSLVTSFAHRLVEDQAVEVDVVAGGESAGIPYGAWLADRLNLPFIYVRKRPKDYGRSAQIEGILERGQTVLLIEDMITDGKSKLNFINAIRTAGGLVNACLVILERGQGGREVLEAEGVTLYALTDFETALGVGEETNALTHGQLRSVIDYLSDAEGWHRARGFGFTPSA